MHETEFDLSYRIKTKNENNGFMPGSNRNLNLI